MIATEITREQFIEALVVGSEWRVHHESFGRMIRNPLWRRVVGHANGDVHFESSTGKCLMILGRWHTYHERPGGVYEAVSGQGQTAVFSPWEAAHV